VERLEQTYVRITGEAACQRYDYAASAFDFGCRLLYDQCGLVPGYPGIAVRAGLTGLNDFAGRAFTCPTHSASTRYPSMPQAA
jgi:hypothetical protein